MVLTPNTLVLWHNRYILASFCYYKTPSVPPPVLHIMASIITKEITQLHLPLEESLHIHKMFLPNVWLKSENAAMFHKWEYNTF